MQRDSFRDNLRISPDRRWARRRGPAASKPRWRVRVPRAVPPDGWQGVSHHDEVGRHAGPGGIGSLPFLAGMRQERICLTGPRSPLPVKKESAWTYETSIYET